MAENRGEVLMSFRDYDGEASSVTFNGPIISDLSADNSAWGANATALVAATQNICHNELNRTRMTYYTNLVSTDKADTQLSMREQKWLVRYRDTVTYKMHSVEIPCADASECVVLTSPHDGAQRLDLESVNGAAFVTAFEDFVVAGDSYANPVEIVDVLLVHRNI